MKSGAGCCPHWLADGSPAGDPRAFPKGVRAGVKPFRSSSFLRIKWKSRFPADFWSLYNEEVLEAAQGHPSYREAPTWGAKGTEGKHPGRVSCCLSTGAEFVLPFLVPLGCSSGSTPKSTPRADFWSPNNEKPLDENPFSRQKGCSSPHPPPIACALSRHCPSRHRPSRSTHLVGEGYRGDPVRDIVPVVWGYSPRPWGISSMKGDAPRYCPHALQGLL